MEKYTVCLCGGGCPNKKDILEYCQVIDNDHYIVINDELVAVNFDKYNYFSDEYFDIEYDCVIIYFENILKFNDFIANENLFSKLNHRKTTCNYFKFVVDYLEYISKNNIINHIKHYLKNDYFDNIFWNHYLREKIFEYSDVSTIRSCLKYLPIEHVNRYFLYSLSRNDNIILDYLVDKIKIYLTSYFTGKNYRGNMFKITNKDELVETPNIFNILTDMLSYNRKNDKIMEVYHQTIDRFQELLESQENINIKKKLIPLHNKVKSKLMYNENIKNDFMCFVMGFNFGKSLYIIKQLLMDGANLHILTNNMINSLLNDSINKIVKKKNLDLLDILFEMKLIDQSKLNLILEKSIGKIDFKNDEEPEIDENFIRELSGYGADVDECFDKLIKTAKKRNNNKLVGYLKNLKNDLM